MVSKRSATRSDTSPTQHRVRYRTPDGTSHRRSFSSKTEAAEFKQTIQDAKAQPTIAGQKQAFAAVSLPIPLDECIRKFLAASTNGTRGRAVLAENTLRNYAIKLALVLRYLEEHDVRKIQRRHVVALKDKLVELNYARKTVNHVLVTLRVLCNWLIDEGLIEQNPTTRVTLKKDRNYPQEHVEQTTIYSDRDVEVILATFDEESFTGLRDKVCVQLGFFCGLRISEVLGLEWRHIDFERKHITVEQSAHDRKGTIERTKSAASRRVVPMNAIVCNSLLRWQDHCIPDTLRIFTTDSERPLIQRNLLRSLQIAQRKAQLPLIRTFHETRHYFASKLIEVGFNLVHIARIIGHADIALTLRVYGHLINQAEDRTAEYNRISAALDEAFCEPPNHAALLAVIPNQGIRYAQRDQSA